MSNLIDAKLGTLKERLPDMLWDEPNYDYLDINQFLGRKRQYWCERIIAQLEYARKLSKINNDKFDYLIEPVIDFLSEKLSEEDVITRTVALEAETMLMDLSNEAKKYKLICAGHSHIDMNWMWSWDETVSITIDTFRTVLDLMREYPEFKFSQSQASVYAIVEKYHPEMLEEIKSRVKEGRWEVTASTWVENDKNVPNGESLVRQTMYTKKYLSRLLDIDMDDMDLDFEPDTFGHSRTIPEILANGGVKYYYHGRGFNGTNIFKWVAPSGKYIIGYKEPIWYNGQIFPYVALCVPEFCNTYGLDTMLKLYGVGDHGGGPTRRDIELIMDMDTWPVFPQFKFGTFKEYFKYIEKLKDKLPEVKEELNFAFTGCYTSQTRIKMANRKSEVTLNEAEMFSSLSSLATGAKYYGSSFEEAWRHVLFGQFHDIIPGSGVLETREHAMGNFQEVMAIANTKRSNALWNISSQIDTSGIITKSDSIDDSISEGAGAGYGISGFKISQYEKGRGKTRIIHVFNPSAYERSEITEIVVWDWKGKRERILFKDIEGNVIEHQVLNQGIDKYWGHEYLRILLKVKVPACGYATFVMTEGDNCSKGFEEPYPLRTEKEYGVTAYVLENNLVKAVFDNYNGSLLSLTDKTTGDELIDNKHPGGIFRLIQEDTNKGGNAWVIGPYMSVKDLTENARVKKVEYYSNNLRQSISYGIKFNNSEIKVTVSLDADSTKLDYNVECDWHEIGRPGESVPQLSFYLPVRYRCSSYKYDIPLGTITREEIKGDVPANSWVCGLRDDMDMKSVMLVTDSKYGFRSFDSSMSITLIRSTTGPDPYPEVGKQKFAFAIHIVNTNSNKKLIEYAQNYNHPLNIISGTTHSGKYPLEKSFITIEEGSVVLSALKMAEEQSENKKCVIRLYETEGVDTKVVVNFFRKPERVYFVDINEVPVQSVDIINIEDNKIIFDVHQFSLVNICAEFR